MDNLEIIKQKIIIKCIHKLFHKNFDFALSEFSLVLPPVPSVNTSQSQFALNKGQLKWSLDLFQRFFCDPEWGCGWPNMGHAHRANLGLLLLGVLAIIPSHGGKKVPSLFCFQPHGHGRAAFKKKKAFVKWPRF